MTKWFVVCHPDASDPTPEAKIWTISRNPAEPGWETDGGHPGYGLTKTEAKEILESIDDNERLFDLRWKADMRAIKRWQAAHPGNDLVWPDHADLCVWLMEQLEAKQ